MIEDQVRKSDTKEKRDRYLIELNNWKKLIFNIITKPNQI